MRYIKEIKKINHLFEDISVSLGWKEYQNQDNRTVLENGIKVLTMGHRTENPDFLLIFYNEVSKYEYISSDTFCTAILWIIYEKKMFYLW